MSTAKQHRIFHGVYLRDILISIGAEPSNENIMILKTAFKSYLEVPSISTISDRTMAKVLSAIQMLSAREMGLEIPISDAEKSMTDLLNQTNTNYDSNN